MSSRSTTLDQRQAFLRLKLTQPPHRERARHYATCVCGRCHNCVRRLSDRERKARRQILTAYSHSGFLRLPATVLAEDLDVRWLAPEEWGYLKLLWIRDGLSGPDATNLGRSLKSLEERLTARAAKC